jgi:hypothetical protein
MHFDHGVDVPKAIPARSSHDDHDCDPERER